MREIGVIALLCLISFTANVAVSEEAPLAGAQGSEATKTPNRPRLSETDQVRDGPADEAYSPGNSSSRKVLQSWKETIVDIFLLASLTLSLLSVLLMVAWGLKKVWCLMSDRKRERVGSSSLALVGGVENERAASEEKDCEPSIALSEPQR